MANRHAPARKKPFCRMRASVLSSYVLGESDEATTARVERHLDRCPACREKVRLAQQAQKAAAAARLSDQTSGNPGYAATRIMAQVRAESTTRKTVRGRRVLHWVRSYGAVAAVAVVVLSVVLLAPRSNMTEAPLSDEAQQERANSTTDVFSDKKFRGRTSGYRKEYGCRGTIIGR